MTTLEKQEAVGGISPIEDRSVSARTAVETITRTIGIAAILTFVVLALVPNGATRIYLWPWTLAAMLLALAPIALLFLNGFGRRFSLGRPANWLVGLLAGVLVLSASLSGFAYQSLENSLFGLGMLAAIFCTAAYVRSGGPEGRSLCLQKWIGWFGLAFCLVSLSGWYFGDVMRHSQAVLSANSALGEVLRPFSIFDVRNQYPLGHSNYTAGLALLLLPWMSGLAISARGLKRSFWLGATLLVGFVLFTSGSRGSILGLAAIAIGGLASLGIRRVIRPRTLVLLGLVATVGLIAAVFSQPRIRSLVQDWRETGELNSGDVQRWSMLKAGLRMGAENPIIGQGPGVTPLTYPAYRADLDGGVDAAFQLHSLPLQIWADLGLAGLALSGLLLFLGIRRVLSVFTETSGSPSGDGATISANGGVLVTSAALSTAGYLAFSLTDFQLDIPVLAGLLAVNLGVIFGSTPMKSARDKPRLKSPFRSQRGLALAGATILLLPVLWTVGQSTLARRAHAIAVGHLERNEPEGFVNGIGDAMRWSPDNALYPASAAVGLLRLSYQSTNPEAVAALESQAIGFYRESLAINDDQEMVHFNLGWLLLETEPEEAEYHFEKAASLVPDKGGVYLGRGLACLEQGDRDGAIRGLALEIVNDPVFAVAPFWDVELFSPLQPESINQAAALLAAISTHPDPGDPTTARESAETAALLRELAGGQPSSSVLSDRAETFRAFFRADGSPNREAIEEFLIKRRHRAVTDETVDACVSLFVRSGSDPRAALLDPAGREAPLIRQERRERPGYGILMRNLDIPLPLDAYIVQTNGVPGLFFPDLFPSKGWLPSTTMVRLAQDSDDDPPIHAYRAGGDMTSRAHHRESGNGRDSTGGTAG